MALQANKEVSLIYTLSNNYTTGIKEEGINFQITSDIVIKNAYIKILTVEGTKENLNISVGIHNVNKTLMSIEHYSFTPIVANNSDNFIKQGYEYIKTLPGYANAVDVLEEGQIL